MHDMHAIHFQQFNYLASEPLQKAVSSAHLSSTLVYGAFLRWGIDSCSVCWATCCNMAMQQSSQQPDCCIHVKSDYGLSCTAGCTHNSITLQDNQTCFAASSNQLSTWAHCCKSDTWSHCGKLPEAQWAVHQDSHAKALQHLQYATRCNAGCKAGCKAATAGQKFRANKSAEGSNCKSCTSLIVHHVIAMHCIYMQQHAFCVWPFHCSSNSV